MFVSLSFYVLGDDSTHTILPLKCSGMGDGVVKDSGLSPDLTSYNTTLNACANNGDWKLVATILKNMASDGLKPDVISFSAIIKACERGGNSEKAAAVKSEINAAGDVASSLGRLRESVILILEQP